jgi:hypothetical protein
MIERQYRDIPVIVEVNEIWKRDGLEEYCIVSKVSLDEIDYRDLSTSKVHRVFYDFFLYYFRKYELPDGTLGELETASSKNRTKPDMAE